MAISVIVELGFEFAVKASTKDVFALLADVPASAAFYPKVDKLVDLGGGAYRWEMQKIGIAQANLQTIYASTYVANKAAGSVVWTPVKGEGNAEVSGSWKISPSKKGSKLALHLHGVVSVPLPGLMKMVVAPLVKAEFEKMTEQYIANLTQHFGGAA
jgi:carbon monoxide dehydrogenase subunit G